MPTKKQQRFIEEYLVDLNGKQAAIRAGYAASRAEVTASELVRNSKVQKALAKAMADRSARTEITQDKMLSDLEAVKADAMQLRSDGQGMLDRSAALKAIELEMKHLGMFVLKIEQEAKVEYPSSLNAFYGSDDEPYVNPGDGEALEDS